jgi:formylglycine-generating enzyme required for sulfatase activity
MNDEVIDILIKIRKIHGESVFDNAGKLKSMLADYAAGRHKGEIRILLIAVDDGLPTKLRNSSDLSGAALRQHATYFSRTYGLAEDAANFVVNAWARALGLSVGMTSVSPPPISNKAVPETPLPSPPRPEPQPIPHVKPSNPAIKMIGAALVVFIGLVLMVWWSGRSSDESVLESTSLPSEEKPVRTAENIKMDLEMVLVEGGTFMMGCTSEQGNDCFDREKPAHRVEVGDFHIGRYEVTQAQWKMVMGSNPSYFEGDDLPVASVSWNDVQEFIRLLNEQTGKRYRLPTEAEWEYAARGGNKSKGYKYSGSNYVDDVAWYYGNSGDKAHPVGTKRANELGLHDMSGNVWEWCRDWLDSYVDSAQVNPGGPSAGSARVMRGGSWGGVAQYARSAIRNRIGPDVRDGHFGFRLAASAQPSPPSEDQLDRTTAEERSKNEALAEQRRKEEARKNEEERERLAREDERLRKAEAAMAKTDFGIAMIRVAGDFYIGKYEVTQTQWKSVMGNSDNPSHFKGDNLPVENVSWDDVQKFINKLKTLTGKNYRLPTEAEWEYAARGGAKTKGYKYSGGNYLDDVAWYAINSGTERYSGSGGKTHAVGTKKPNELGIYDMSGNVWEWCYDNDKGSSSGSTRVIRGGAWISSFQNMGISARDSYAPNYRYINLGFRLAVSLE